MSAFPEAAANDDYCYLVTTGRKTGLDREIEIWFALQNGTLYVLAGGGERAHWVRNLRADPFLRVRIRDQVLDCRARDVATADEDALARRLLFEKYQPRGSRNLDDWRERALPLAIEVTG